MGQHFGATPFLIAGPCVVESDALNLRIGEALAELGTKLGVHVIYKASYDKANRSRLKGARGPGLERGLQALATVRSETGLPILTDVHDAVQVAAAAQVADVLQIPAFLCRQTDLLVAAGRAGRAVNVKKGQWLSPDGMQGAVEKVRAGGAPEVAVTERGTFFGYGDLVVDMRTFARLRAACGVPVVYDATHSVQQPGKGEGGSSGGLREFIAPLLYAAAAAGADGFFLETHPDPDRAPSDGPNMLPLDQLPTIVSVALEVWQRVRETVRASALEPLARRACTPLGRCTPLRHRPYNHSAAPPWAAPARCPPSSGVQRDGPAGRRGRPWVADAGRLYGPTPERPRARAFPQSEGRELMLDAALARRLKLVGFDGA